MRWLDGWHHRLSEYEFEQALEDGQGQGRLECCSPCGHKGFDRTEILTTKILNVWKILAKSELM